MANTFLNPELLTSLRNLAGENEALRKGLESGLDLSGLGGPNASPSSGFFGFGSLGRVGDTLNVDQSQMLQEARKVTPQVSPEAQQGLTDLAIRSREQRNIDPGYLHAQTVAAQRLGGLTAPEMTALREQGQAEINRQLQTNMRNLGLQNAAQGLRGGAAMAPAVDFSRGALDARRNLERDLLLANVAERRNALQDFTNVSQGINAADLANAQQRDQNILSLIGAGQQQQNLNEAQRQNRLTNYSNVFNQINQDLLGRNVFNLGQLEKEKAGQLGLLFGTAGLSSQEQARKESLDLANKQLDILQNQEIPAANPINLFLDSSSRNTSF